MIHYHPEKANIIVGAFSRKSAVNYIYGEWRLLEDMAYLNVEIHIVGNKMIFVNSLRIQPISESKEAQIITDFLLSLIGKYKSGEG